MGYTTEFSGRFVFDKPLTNDQKTFINCWGSYRRMAHDIEKLKPSFYEVQPIGFDKNCLELYKKTGLDKIHGPTFGVEGEFYFQVTEPGYPSNGFGDLTVLDHNRPPKTQPGLWCQWIVSKDRKTLMWDGGEKFYDYIQWLEYMIKNFFTPWGISMFGKVEWRGEDFHDCGVIQVNGTKILVTRK